MIEPAVIARALEAETNQPWGAVVDATDHALLGVPIITGPDGARLHLRQQRDRLLISGGYGEALSWCPRQRGLDAIGVAADSPPERIAREIARRLLPGYLPALATARATLARHQQQVTAAEAALAYLLTVAGGGRRSANTREIEAHLTGGAVHRVHVRPTESGPAVQLELHRVDVETAHEVVRLLAGRGHL